MCVLIMELEQRILDLHIWLEDHEWFNEEPEFKKHIENRLTKLMLDYLSRAGANIHLLKKEKQMNIATMKQAQPGQKTMIQVTVTAVLKSGTNSVGPWTKASVQDETGTIDIMYGGVLGLNQAVAIEAYWKQDAKYGLTFNGNPPKNAAPPAPVHGNDPLKPIVGPVAPATPEFRLDDVSKSIIAQVAAKITYEHIMPNNPTIRPEEGVYTIAQYIYNAAKGLGKPAETFPEPASFSPGDSAIPDDTNPY